MNILISAGALVLLIIVAVINNIDKTKIDLPETTSSPEPTVLSFTPSPQPTLMAPVGTASPTDKPKLLLGGEFIYPDSDVAVSEIGFFELLSVDTPEAITAWYKDKIVSEGYNTKSFVQTSTNGTVLNKLGAAKGDSSILVEINKSVDSSLTRITVELDN